MPTPATSSTSQNNCVIREHLDQGVPTDFVEAEPHLLGDTWGVWIANPMELHFWKAGQKDEKNGEHGRVGKINEIGSFIVAGLISRIMQNLISSLEDKQQSGILMHQTFSPG